MTSGLRKFVFFVVVVGVALIAYLYMIKPANKRLAAARAAVQSKLDKLGDFEKTTVAVKDLSEQLDRLEEAIAFFESKLPPASEIDEVLRNVTVIVQKQGLVSKMIKTMKKENCSGYVEQPLKMQLVGNFNAFYSFLLELEKLPRIMKIRELKLDKKHDHEGQIEADFIVSIFFQNTAAG